MKIFNRIFSVVEYALFIAATAMVIAFQFMPYQSFVIFAISGYMSGFFMMFVHKMVETIHFFAVSRKVMAEDSALITSGKIEVVKSKKEKITTIILTILWFALFVFALLVLIFYIKKM